MTGTAAALAEDRAVPQTPATEAGRITHVRVGLSSVSFILPAAIMLAVFLLYPIIDTFWLSVHNVNEFGQLQGYAGFGNFLHVFRDPAFRGSLLRSAIWTIATVVVTTVMSLFVAVVLSQPWRGRGFVRGILLLPWASSLVVTTLLWQWIADPDFGALNHLGRDLGLVTSRVAWLGSANTALPLMIWIAIWVSVPPTSLIILAGLQGIDRDVYDAAALDKTRGARLFFDMTLPLLRPVLTVSVLLNVIFVFNSFPIIWILTEGGPVGTTNTLPTYMYNLGFELYEMGDAAAVAVIMFAILLAFSVVYTRLFWKNLAR